MGLKVPHFIYNFKLYNEKYIDLYYFGFIVLKL